MKMLKYIKRSALIALAKVSEYRVLHHSETDHIKLDDFASSLADSGAYYSQAYCSFQRELPEALRSHREYFKKDGRGFGEDAFHTMWWLLFQRFQPANFLEIGVYRGQTLSLAALISQLGKFPCEIHGISPFSDAGDSVSEYVNSVDYIPDVIRHFDHFSLPHPTLLRAYSTDPEAVALIKSRKWDCIYIDGNHDYEVVAADWHCCAGNVRPGGCIVLDDSGLSSGYRPPRFATGGHPGPSRVAAEIDRSLFTEILQVGHNRVFQLNEA
jgi:hypothetical protein